MKLRILVAAACVYSVIGSSFSWAGEMKASDFFKSTTELSLAEAAAAGRTDKLDDLLAHGANVNARGVDGMTALLWAMSRRSKKGVAWLLEHGADPNVVLTLDGSSAISLAAMQEDPWYLKEVLAHGGNLNIRNPLNGHTPLVDAMAGRLDNNARLLIAAGANMNTFDSLGLTPLIEAAANQRYELVYDMLVAGADPTIPIAKWGGKTLLSVIRDSRVLPDAPAYQWQLKVIELLKKKGLDVEQGK